MNKVAVGRKIKELRNSMGLTQAKLAELVDMHEKHISRIESGKYVPNLDNLVKIFTVLNQDISNIFDENDISLNINPEKMKLLKLVNSATDKEVKFYLGLLEQAKRGLKNFV